MKLTDPTLYSAGLVSKPTSKASKTTKNAKQIKQEPHGQS